ncbi:hypothetical protein [Actinomadura sp. CNU-125]|nr:hypothetical protein [Actinomadura sp. CNU-125]
MSEVLDFPLCEDVVRDGISSFLAHFFGKSGERYRAKKVASDAAGYI